MGEKFKSGNFVINAINEGCYLTDPCVAFIFHQRNKAKKFRSKGAKDPTGGDTQFNLEDSRVRATFSPLNLTP